MSINYLKLLEYPFIKFNGFADLGDFVYVTISRTGPILFLHAKELPERDYRFRISLPTGDNRVISHPQLYHLLNDFGLDNKAFIFNSTSQFYLPTSIPVEDEV